MERKRYNFAFALLVVFACICLQLCFWENKAIAGATTFTLTPGDGSTGVALDANITITFSENWYPDGSGDPLGDFRIYDMSTGTIFEQYSFPSPNITGAGTPTLTINPTSNFAPNTQYGVMSAGYAQSVLHFQSGNPYIGNTWYFTTTTACYNPPTCIGPCFAEDPNILHKSPPDNGHFMQAYEGLNLILDRIVTVGIGNITIRRYSDDVAVETINITSNKVTGWGTNSITINPTINLADNTHYYVNLDLTNYATAANKNRWDFWTKATPNTFSGTGL